MKRLSILIFSLFSVLVSTTVYAQDDDAVDDETVAAVKKKPRAYFFTADFFDYISVQYQLPALS